MFDLKKQLMWSKLKVGLVITAALAVLFFTVFFAGGIESLLSPKAELKAKIHDVKGLRKGAPVWLSGIEIGSVKDIRLDPGYGTVVTLSVRKGALDYIKKDSHASVLTMGLLGDKYVEISGGSPDAGHAAKGDTIKGAAQIELKDVMEVGTMSIKQVSDFLKKLDTLVSKIEEGQGSIARFISDPALYNNLRDSAKTLSLTLKEMKEAQGSMKLFIEDPSLYNKLLTASSAVERFGNTLNEGSGSLKKIIDDPTLYNKMVAATSSIEEFGKKLNEGQGTLRKLADNAELYDNLNRAALQLSSITERIDRGEGLAGTLVKDKELSGELKGTVVQLKELLKDMREHPKSYFKFSLF
ncbi:MAG TPA: MlaD family protein [Thermodesulfovibrionales bacterium]|nr:MlaD family protein [Thermodesulfovibrionales bacterium]